MKRKVFIAAVAGMLVLLQATTLIEAQTQNKVREDALSLLTVDTSEDPLPEPSLPSESVPEESSVAESSAVSSSLPESSTENEISSEVSSQPVSSADENERPPVNTSRELSEEQEEVSSEESEILPERNNNLWNDEMAVTLTMACDWVRNSDMGDLYLLCMGSAGKSALSKLVNQYITEVYLKEDYTNILNLSYDILNVTFCGYSAENVLGKNLIQLILEYRNYEQENLYANAYALLAVDSNQYTISSIAINSRKNMIRRILSFQNGDGGFADYVGNGSSVVQTALAISALSPYQSEEEVSVALNSALEYLQTNQSRNGSFYENGQPSTSAIAKVIVALNCMGISIDDPRFMKNGETLAQVLLRYVSLDGGFQEGEKEGSDVTATENAILALTSIKKQGSPYQLSNPLVNDSKEESAEETPPSNRLSWVQFVWSAILILAAIFVAVTTIYVKIRDRKDGKILSAEEKYILYHIREENPDEEDKLKK